MHLVLYFANDLQMADYVNDYFGANFGPRSALPRASGVARNSFAKLRQQQKARPRFGAGVLIESV